MLQHFPSHLKFKVLSMIFALGFLVPGLWAHSYLLIALLVPDTPGLPFFLQQAGFVLCIASASVRA